MWTLAGALGESSVQLPTAATDTGRPESEVGLMAKSGSPQVLSGIDANVMVWSALVMVKLASETSKYTLPTASTFTRAVVVAVAGRSTLCVPSLGVLAASTVGKVFPPSVDSEIFTLALLIGATS